MNQNDRQEIIKVIKRLPSYTKLVYALYRAPYVTKKQKVILSTAVGYLVSPIELVPGFIPVAGQVDDLLIVLTILRKVLKSIDPNRAQQLLKRQNMTFATIDEDIALCNRVAKQMVIKGGKFVGRTMAYTGRQGYKLGKNIIGRAKKRFKRRKK